MSDLYPYIKHIHLTTVTITGLLFLLRFIWMIQGRLQQRGRWVRTLPHINDSLLLASGLTMATILGQYPFSANWLTAKLLALLAYIVIGSIALKRGPSRTIRILAGPIAIACYLYIIAVGLTRQPLPEPALLLQILSH
ncbi:SirB2 family protein [Candidatus Endoriftia persephone]|jgi:uncharacterized membrane protein SirB2|uniref:Invasion gene expression up-regulator, SirB n=3 Tax=Gammaproteobacteria TaxID=1236 RepID=G2FC19_9GAMM|nr:SirB2 family protein [Candidatus Endoriftia persephone]EGV52024.1 invasion gene expression up-regulator, SirB [endosymbiont of Riftia pachyptila (vent Ph05)]EGW55850.1 invasion gene expression up-regulator, SirB [endosymbiont of Tevnia jerichonana (vent Tica)]USF86180.1 SirB2 family protein [Candidatus Endoriftia persephone]